MEVAVLGCWVGQHWCLQPGALETLPETYAARAHFFGLLVGAGPTWAMAAPVATILAGNLGDFPAYDDFWCLVGTFTVVVITLDASP
jgi:hypothetical protein